MKTVIVLKNEASNGKTSTLRELQKLVKEKFPELVEPLNDKVHEKGDFRYVFKLSGKFIAIESCGDPGSNIKKNLVDLETKFTCNLIFCATRTKGQTVKDVKEFAEEKHFEIVWSSTYAIDFYKNSPNKSETGKHYDSLNQLKARHLFDLMQELLLK